MPDEGLPAKFKRFSARSHAVPFEAAVNLSDKGTAADKHHTLDKRAGLADMKPNWALGYVGVPPRTNINGYGRGWWDPFGQTYKYQRDDSECQGQYVYVVENQFDASHPVSLIPPFMLL